jgi:hypothetical protein
LQNALRECSKRKKVETHLQNLGPEAIDWLLNDWELWAREDQLPPGGDWTSWLKYLGPFIQVLSAIMKLFVGHRQRRVGRLEANNEQLSRDHETLRKAADARSSVHNDAERVRNDPRNRDAR